MGNISYKAGYKYQITEDYIIQTNILPDSDIDTPYIKLSKRGVLTIVKGYAWDGPSGPTVDTKTFMRGSLVHDAFYQLMRNKYLDKRTCRQPADRLMQQICKQDGMNPLRAWLAYEALKLWGDPAADPSNKKSVITAP